MSNYCCSIIWVKLSAISGLNAEKACWPSAVAILMCKNIFFVFDGRQLFEVTQFGLAGTRRSYPNYSILFGFSVSHFVRKKTI